MSQRATPPLAPVDRRVIYNTQFSYVIIQRRARIYIFSSSCILMMNLVSRSGLVNETEPTQRGGFIYRGEIAQGVWRCFYNLYTQQKTPRVTDRSFTSLARLFPEHENPLHRRTRLFHRHVPKPRMSGPACSRLTGSAGFELKASSSTQMEGI